MPVGKGDADKVESTSHFTEVTSEEDILQAAVLALTAFFRFGTLSCVHANYFRMLFLLFRCCVGLFPRIAVLKSDIRGGGKTGKKAVEQSYSVVLSALILQLGSCHGLSGLDHQDNSRCTDKFNNPSST